MTNKSLWIILIIIVLIALGISVYAWRVLRVEESPPIVAEINLYLYEDDNWRNLCPIEQFKSQWVAVEPHVDDYYTEKFTDKELDLSHNGYKDLLLAVQGGAASSRAIVIMSWNPVAEKCEILKYRNEYGNVIDAQFADHMAVMTYANFDIGDYDKSYEGLEIVTEIVDGNYNENTGQIDSTQTFRVYHWDKKENVFVESENLRIKKTIKNTEPGDVEKII